MPPFALATTQINEAHQTILVIYEKFYSLSEIDFALASKSIKQLLGVWETTFPLLQNAARGIVSGDIEIKPLDPKTVTLSTPIRYPNKLLAVGANYTSHLEEVGLPAEKWDPMPFFSVPPTSTIVGPGKTVKYPSGTKQFDWECELTVVMGKPLQNANLEEARNAIAGYTIGLDLSCRDLQMGAKGMLDIMRGKGQDGMKPIGPYFYPKECLEGDAGNLDVELKVNGEVMMRGSTKEMLWKTEECLVEISRVVSLEPGDMIMTGTPAGSAKGHGERWLRVGDLIEAGIGELGVLEVEVVE